MSEIRARCGVATWNLIGVEAHEFDELDKQHAFIGLPVCYRMPLTDPPQVWPKPQEDIQVYEEKTE